MLKKLDIQNFDSMFSLLERAFPPDERRPYEEQKALFDESTYGVYVAEKAGKLQGFLAVWEWERVAFIEHFAVEPACRNGGIGGKMLEALCARVQGTLCLEVEPPTDELTRRRIGFYQRHGFVLNEYPYMQPAISAGKTPIPLMLMTYGKALSPDEFARVKDLLYTTVYKMGDK